MEGNVNALSRSVVLILLLWLLFFLAVYNLDMYPPIWFDEGIFLQPPKNLVLYGEYALREGDIFYRFSSLVGTGPPLLLPIAFAFRVIGLDLWQARFVTVSYLMLMAAVFYKLADRLYGAEAGLLALGVIVASPLSGIILHPRARLSWLPAGIMQAIIYQIIYCYLSMSSANGRRVKGNREVTSRGNVLLHRRSWAYSQMRKAKHS